ncbi:MAG: winged helix-turn-helix domain-containing protein [Acidobacteria bacterium]|nr:winged helix-turn-helix domain-containing protein [Acidobacteriota bacterium]
MQTDSKDLYEFGQFRVIASERQLLLDGEPVPLTPKAFDLLLALLEQPGRLITKEALIERVWPNTFVEENNLADNISRLRKALGESGNGAKFIETVPRRGYRFVAAVASQNGEASCPDSATPPIPQPSLHTRPSWLRWCVVVVAPVLVGAVIWVQMRLSAKAEARNLEFKGSFYYNQWTDPEIRKGIAFHERAILLDPGNAGLYNGLSTGWLFLADLYAPPRETIPHAKAAIAKALERDPSNAWSHTSRGLIAAQYDWDWASAEAEFKQAIRIAPEFESAHILYGWHLMAVGRLQDAVNEIKPIVEANPLNDFAMWSLGLALHFSGRLDEAIEQYRRAVGIDRRSHWAHMLLGWSLEQQGKFEEAVAELKLAYSVNDNPQVLASMGHTYAVSGRPAEARKIAGQLLELARGRYVSPYDVAVLFAALGEREDAFSWLEKAYQHRCGWLALWLKVDQRFNGLRDDSRFQGLLRRVGHRI